MRVKGGRAENTIVSVITLDRHPDICRFAFQKQLSTYGITGGSGELVVDKHESAAMIHINCSTGVSIWRGTMAWRGNHPTWYGRNEMITADTVTRLDVILLDPHVWRGCGMGGPNCRWMTSGFRNFTCHTEQVVTGCGWNIVGAWKKGAITQTHQIRWSGRAGIAPLSGDILNCRKPGMREALVLQEKFFLGKSQVLVGSCMDIASPNITLRCMKRKTARPKAGSGSTRGMHWQNRKIGSPIGSFQSHTIRKHKWVLGKILLPMTTNSLVKSLGTQETNWCCGNMIPSDGDGKVSARTVQNSPP